MEVSLAYMILVAEDPQTREVLRQRLERNGHHVLGESERPEGADPRHVFCELNTTKAGAQDLVIQLRREFSSVRAIVIA
jgi:hypothetical protein